MKNIFFVQIKMLKYPLAPVITITITKKSTRNTINKNEEDE